MPFLPKRRAARTGLVIAALAVLLAAGGLAHDYAAFAGQCRAGVTRFMRESLWPSRHPEEDSYYNAIAYTLWQDLASNAPDVLYFNDSVMGAHNSHEPQETLAQLVAAATNLSVRGLSAPGLCPVLVKGYARVLAQAAHKPRLVIFNINPRALTVRDFFDLTYYFGNLRQYLAILALAPGPKSYLAWCVARLKGQDFTGYLKAVCASDAFPAREDYFATHRQAARGPFTTNCDQADPEAAGLCRLFIDNYMIDLDDQHPMLLVLGEALAVLRQAGITPIVYVTPVNMEEARALAGPEFERRMRGNIARLRQGVAPYGVDLLDLSELLPPDLFVDRQWACEHLAFAGRQRVAALLAQAIGPGR